MQELSAAAAEDDSKSLFTAAEDDSHESHFSDSSDEEIDASWQIDASGNVNLSVYELPDSSKIEPGICVRLRDE